MKKSILYSLILILGYACNDTTPCKCWKYSYYSTHTENCNKAARKMGIEKWDKKERECKDFRLVEDKENGYVKIDMVVMKGEKGEPSYYWREVYVKE